MLQKTAEIRERVQMELIDLENGSIFVGGAGKDYAEPELLLTGYANRHGLIAGATGTGKTVTLQTLAESLPPPRFRSRGPWCELDAMEEGR